MELNILLRGQSNALLFDQLGGYATVQTDVNYLLGFDGVTSTVNLLGGATPDAEGNVTAVGATGLLPPAANHWLNLVNGDYTQGFTAGPIEQGLLNYIDDLPADERAAPTVVLYMHDESDASIAGGETTAEWMAAVQYDAGLVRQAFGQTAATVPYLFVPVPFDSDDAATMQAIRLGQEELAADPAFDGAIATHTGDLNMDNPFNGLPAGDVIYGGPHIDQEDAAIRAARIAPSVADAFAQYALPGSPLALAGGYVDDTGPQAVRVDWVPAQPTQLIVTLQDDPSSVALQPLGTEAAAGLGWTIRDGTVSIAATSAQELPGHQLLLTFAGAVPADATALLFYDYGTGRLAVGATTHTGSGYPGVGAGSPGEGNAIYDTAGLPAWSSAAGLAIGSAPVATIVGAMQMSAGLTLYEGDTLAVQDGGSVQATTVLTGGMATLSAGGTAIGTVVDGGAFTILAGGSASGTTVSGGSETVLSGGTETGGTVFAGASLVLSGGTATGETIGGVATVDAGGVLAAPTLSAGATVVVGDGGMLSGSFQDMGEIVFDISTSAAPGATFSGSGSILVTGGGTLTLAPASALTGTITINASTLDLTAPGAAGSATVAFTGSPGLLVLSAGDTGIVVGGMAPGGGQTIEVEGFSAVPALTHLGDSLTLAAAGSTTALDLVGSADYTVELTEVATSDGLGYSVFLTEGATPCYCGGTRILTEGGEVRVEELAIGDRVITASGATRAIRWIGRRSFIRRMLRGQPGLLPILFRAGSLGSGIPHRELRISPEHAVFLGGVLVPARCLVNGATIVRDHACQYVDYVHIELDRHDVILAEGAACETFLDDDSRAMFHNASEFARLCPEADGPGLFYAPRVTHGYALEAIRRRLAPHPAAQAGAA